ncbi:MAG TPA: hypothetical protein VK469_22120 [Candidatus Kapabacteria bacterium]|nr:hypothetical protein [Candidatus Kapabacteria bacterium]
MSNTVTINAREEKIPNKETIKVFKDTDAGKNLNYCENFDDMFKQLDI